MMMMMQTLTLTYGCVIDCVNIFFFYNGGPESETLRKRKERQVLGSCQRTKKLLIMIETEIPLVIDAFGTVLKGLERRLKELEIGGRAKTIQTTALLKINQNTEKVFRKFEETCFHSYSGERPQRISQEVELYTWR